MTRRATDPNSEHLTIRDLTKLLQVSRWTVGRWIESNELRAIKRRGRVLIPRDAYDEFLQRNTERPTTEEATDGRGALTSPPGRDDRPREP